MRTTLAWCVLLLVAQLPGVNSFAPRPRLSGHRGCENHVGRRPPYCHGDPALSTGKRRTIRSCAGNDHQLALVEGIAADARAQELVLREFVLPLQADPGSYERMVRAEGRRGGDVTATVVRWHISRADRENGKAHVEAVFLTEVVPEAGA